MAEEKVMDFAKVEKKWQDRWEKAHAFRTPQGRKKKKCYVLEMFPYPSAAGLHMGHIRNYSIGDCVARYKRMKGFDVLYPMGYDAFGLPAENAAIKNKTHPRIYTEKAIDGIKKNQKSLGLSYDWEREIATCEPSYYRWNQWMFLRMLEKGLAYKKEAPVNWCPKCETVLANEQVDDGKCWRCNSDVTEKMISQWFFKITKYADELLKDLDKLSGWPERIRIMQENWIGKSHGVDIHFRLDGTDKILPTFTTRCDTVFSVTFIAIAPEHPMLSELTKGTGQEKAVKDFVMRVKKQAIVDRTNEEKEKEGVFTGRHAINPVNGEKVPVYVANFAVMYGSGIVMCDAHDKRDFRFARKYKIPLKFVISADGKKIDPKDYDDAFTDDGVLFDSGEFNGMKNREALPQMGAWLEKKGFGKRVVNYKLRDWGVSRQRYWGTPIPVTYCEKCGIVPVDEKELPVLLPDDVQFTGHGNPLEKHEKFTKAKCGKCGGAARRETDTMDTFVDSSWYFLRYCDPNAKSMFNKDEVAHWMPVDQYIGGAEHAVMHLLYARFFVKVLRDMGMLSFDEPFTKLFNQGIVYRDGHKMSKSFGNAVTQEEIAQKYGIDTARVFLLFVASPESQVEWSDKGIQGAARFLSRYYNFISTGAKLMGAEKQGKVLSLKDRMLKARISLTVAKVTEQIENFQLNLAISTAMDFLSYMQAYSKGNVNPGLYREAVTCLMKMMSPFAPHTSEELWEACGMKGFVSVSEWPVPGKADEKAMEMESLIERLKEDMENVIKLSGLSPKEIKVVVSSQWKYALMKKLSSEKEKTRNVGEVMKAVMSDGALRAHGQDVSRIVPAALKNPERVCAPVLSQEEELLVIREMVAELSEKFSCAVSCEAAEKSQSKKAANAMPGKPGIEVM